MRVLGIDPGTARMGYSVVKSKVNGVSPEIVVSDVLITPAGMDMELRLKMLHRGLHELISKHKPDVMVIEKLFFSTNVKTAMTVGQARGIALLSAADHDLKVYEYTALQAKKLLTGYGRASKKDMQNIVMEIFNLTRIIKSDDANDAVAMALCFIRKNL
jgi:crossover junction endodeoxyribonuclease RuvC